MINALVELFPCVPVKKFEKNPTKLSDEMKCGSSKEYLRKYNQSSTEMAFKILIGFL